MKKLLAVWMMIMMVAVAAVGGAWAQEEAVETITLPNGEELETECFCSTGYMAQLIDEMTGVDPDSIVFTFEELDDEDRTGLLTYSDQERMIVFELAFDDWINLDYDETFKADPYFIKAHAFERVLLALLDQLPQKTETTGTIEVVTLPNGVELETDGYYSQDYFAQLIADNTGVDVDSINLTYEETDDNTVILTYSDGENTAVFELAFEEQIISAQIDEPELWTEPRAIERVILALMAAQEQ